MILKRLKKFWRKETLKSDEAKLTENRFLLYLYLGILFIGVILVNPFIMGMSGLFLILFTIFHCYFKLVILIKERLN